MRPDPTETEHDVEDEVMSAGAMSPCPKDSPLMIAWEKYKTTKT